MNEPQLDAGQRAAQAQFDRRSNQYGKSHILADVSDLEDAFAGLPSSPGARALDVATGGGHTALFLLRRGYAVTACDISVEMLHRAEELAAEAGWKIHTRQHPAESLPDADETYAVVTCRVAAHHFSAPERFGCEVARVLRPGGYLVLIDGSVPDEEPEAEAWIHAVECLRDPSHGRFLSPGRWKALLSDAGLAVRDCRLVPFKQPDLEWYFATAATPAENRQEVLRLLATASARVREVFRLGEEGGKIIWWWPRMTLVAQKPLP